MGTKSVVLYCGWESLFRPVGSIRQRVRYLPLWRLKEKSYQELYWGQVTCDRVHFLQNCGVNDEGIAN